MSDSAKKRDHWVGFDLGGTKMLAAVFDPSFEIVGRRRKKTRGHEGQKVGLERIASGIRDALDEAKVDVDQLGGIGIGCPGPIKMDEGVIAEAPNLGWHDVPVRESLENEFGRPVAVLNDVDAGVYGEYAFGAGKGARCVLGVFPGTGIGGGCVYEGKILRGAVYSAMEIGHVFVSPEGYLSGSSRAGVLELGASRLAIAAAAAQAAYRGEAPRLHDKVGTDLSAIRSGALQDAVENGDEVVERIVREAAERIGTTVASVVHLLSPDVIVLGGGLVEAMPKLFAKTVKETARDRVLPTYADTFDVKVAGLGDDAGVRGAAAWARDTLGESAEEQPAPVTATSTEEAKS